MFHNIKIFYSLLQQKETPNYLLDLYPGDYVSYSLRILKSSFASSAPLRVRRSADNVEADVLFDTNGLVSLNSAVINKSTSTPSTNLGEFVWASGYSNTDGLASANTAFVTRWRNQSSLGSTGDLINTTPTQQPRIVVTGVLQTTNGHVAMTFVAGSLNNLVSSALSVSSLDLTMFAVGYPTTNSTGISMFGYCINGTSNQLGVFVSNPSTQGFIYSNTTPNSLTIPSTPYLNEYSYYGILDSSTLKRSFNVTNTTATTITAAVTTTGTFSAFTADRIYMGRRHLSSVSNTWGGTITEAIAYNSNQSSNRTAIQQNQINYW